MRSYDLQEAAHFLRMSPTILRRKAAAGEIRGAKPGKRWVFLEEDLADYLGRLYAASRQAPLSGSKLEIGACRYTNAAMCGGSGSQPPMVREYESLLGLRTSERPKSSTTG